jgi:hypothetical protein
MSARLLPGQARRAENSTPALLKKSGKRDVKSNVWDGDARDEPSQAYRSDDLASVLNYATHLDESGSGGEKRPLITAADVRGNTHGSAAVGRTGARES